jgi:hypothetical protein
MPLPVSERRSLPDGYTSPKTLRYGYPPINMAGSV